MVWSRKKRKTTHGRAGDNKVIGYDRRLYRKLDESTGLWSSCAASEKGKSTDSIVFCYARRIGFKPDTESEDANIRSDPASMQSYLDGWASRDFSRSMVEYYSNYEGITLEVYGHTTQAKFLKRLEEQLEEYDNGNIDLATVERISFEKADEGHVINVLDFLSSKSTKKVTIKDSNGTEHEKVFTGRGNNWGTLDLYLSAISETSNTFGKGRVNRRGRLRPKIKEWERKHQQKQAPYFDFAIALPLIHTAIYSMPRRTQANKLLLHLMIVIQICALARSSCITTHCPKLRSVLFPQIDADYEEDDEPSYVEMTWLNWKHRRPADVDKPYVMRFFANQIDGMEMFCPVTLTMQYITYLVDNQLYNKMWDADEPLWNMSADAYQLRIKDLFCYMSDLYNDPFWETCSSHSFRYSSTRWARRCGAEQKIIASVGRWKDLITLQKYLGEGEADYEEDEDGIDKILKIWVFKSAANASPRY